MKVLVTGATGFVGKRLVQRLRTEAVWQVLEARRKAPERDAAGVFACGDLGPATDWSAALQGVQVVVHCAARVHVMNEREAEPLQAFRQVNVAGTLNLARQAVAAGVRRFVFVSSIKVNGESTEPGHPFKPDDVPAPGDPYGVSKHEAEAALQALARETGLEVVIVRPVLVYGPGVKANFRAMLAWLHRGIPLPFGAIDNRRSLVALDNLVDLLVACMSHPAAAGQVFLAADGEDLSTTALLQRLSLALGREARLLPVPAAWLRWGSRLLGRPAIAQRLCGSLQVDASKATVLLGWHAPWSVDEALRLTAKDFLENRAS